MGQMLAGVAHELNNPLTAILGVTELVREREGLDDSMKRQLDLTHRQASAGGSASYKICWNFRGQRRLQKKPIDLQHDHRAYATTSRTLFAPEPG